MTNSKKPAPKKKVVLTRPTSLNKGLIPRPKTAASLPSADVQIGSNEERLRRMATVIQDSNDAITIQDLDGNILAWNRGAEIIYGYSEAEALQMNIVDTVPESHQSEAMNFIAALKGGALVSSLETKRKTKDGRIIDVWLANTKLVDDQGKLTGVATTGRDITEQTKTLEKFRRMATVIQDSNDAITFQDLDGNILAWNRGAEQIYGYSQAEALSMNIVDTVPKEYQAEAREFLASLKRGELVPNLETKRKHKDGRIIDVWLTNTKLTDDKGNLTGIATTERDISERMGALEKFRRMATVIQDSNDAITFQDLEGNILAWNKAAESIYGYTQAEALRMNIVDTVPSEYLAEAREFLSSLKRGELVPIPVVVASVHNYREKALEMGAIGYILKPSTREVLQDAFAKFESKFSQKIKRVLLVENDKPQRESMVKLISDPDVEITPVALAGEALDALKKSDYDCMVIDLKLPDMSSEQLLQKMTEQKELATFPPVIIYTERSLSRDEEDALRKYSHSIIIKRAKSAEKILDEVSLFLHSVDSKLSPERQKMLKSVRNREDLFEGREILVVDDDVRNIFALTAALEQKGANIKVARNGKEALEKLKEYPRLDLVLMDIMMPEMDGYQATREIRKQERFAKLPIIAVTAKATKNDQALCMEAGADDYLAKPIDIDQLLSLIRVWMPKLGRD